MSYIHIVILHGVGKTAGIVIDDVYMYVYVLNTVISIIDANYVNTSAD